MKNLVKCGSSVPCLFKIDFKLIFVEALKDEKLAELNENLKNKEQDIETQKQFLNSQIQANVKLTQEKQVREVTQTCITTENKN